MAGSSAALSEGVAHRVAGDLPGAEKALQAATAAETGNVLAWTELGVVQRMQGNFKGAKQSYDSAIAADPNYAPAHRNLGVLLDLYLGDPVAALQSFERYKSLTGEEKPVNGWIAELKQRIAKSAAQPAAQTPPGGKP